VLDRAGGGAADHRRDLGGAPLADHDAGRTRALGDPADRPEVARILHLVEHHDDGIG
jgi:hypothetical protein